MTDIMYYTSIPWKFGEIYIAASSKGISRINFDTYQDEGEFLKSFKNDSHEIKRYDDFFQAISSKFNKYFNGENVTFDDAVDLRHGTEFQKLIWHTVTGIPYGQVKTYNEIAKSVGNPKAVRAVGSANARNPVPILIPCHRVISASGKLGGYSGGIKIKEYLLQLEGAII